MPKSIQLNASDEIVAMQNGAVVPPGNIEITDQHDIDIRALRRAARATAHGARVLWNGGVPVLPTDSRLILRVVPDTLQPSAGVPFSLTISAVTAGGVVRTAVNGEQIFEIEGRNFLFDFTAGVATRNITISQSGDWIWGNAAGYRVEAPVTVRVVE